ncbi:FtsX-like permease family protein [Oceanirhabdus sp. W0125-5]|uniref:FtsX-like permease family protein n=1 Tax=Oceanirhabdus sp. W0125-5 TaxID=2999116 RepID=UPI0022F2F369|nr:ABC transporter permease [Oceanirhabdus sp. W0125-5]WBW96870.1 ABC transporter permease [Oceanirhabdus sp. W0125-5]
MTFNQMVFKMFKQKFYLYKNYYICNILSLTMVFIFSTLIFNREIINEEKLGTTVYGFFILCFVISILFSFIFTTISHKDYIGWKKNETGIFKLLGIESHHLKNIFFTENIIIFTLSLISSLFIGTLFSRLFFICLMKLFNVQSIPFKASLEPFLVVIILCAALFIYISIYDNLFINKRGLAMLKNNGENLDLKIPKELITKRALNLSNFKTSIQLALSIFLFVLAHIVLISWEKYGSGSLKTMLVSLLLIFLGINFFLKSFFNLAFAIKDKLNKVKFPYFFIKNFIITSLNRNRKLIYTLIVLIHFVVFFSTIIFFYYNEVNKMINAKYPYDVSLHGKDENYNFLKSAKNHNVDFSEKITIESIYLSQESENKVLGKFNFNVFSNKTYNNLSSSNINLPKGQCLIASNPYFYKVNKDRPSYPPGDTIEVFFNEPKNDYSFKIIDYVPIDINKYLTSSFIIIINDQEFQYFKNNTQIIDLYLYNFKNYEDGLKVHSSLKSEYSYEDLWLLNNSFKIIEDNRENSAYSGMAFMFIFVIILFFITSNTAIYSSFLSTEKQLRTLFSKLIKLGMTHKQFKRIITHLILFMVSLPFIIGSLSGCYYSLMFPPESGALLGILKTTGFIIGTLIIIQGIIIFLFSRSLYKRIIT